MNRSYLSGLNNDTAIKVDSIVCNYVSLVFGEVKGAIYLKLPYLYLRESVDDKGFIKWYDWVHSFLRFDRNDMYSIIWGLVILNLSKFDPKKLCRRKIKREYTDEFRKHHRKYATTWSSFVINNLHYWIHLWFVSEKRPPEPVGITYNEPRFIKSTRIIYPFYHADNAALNSVMYMWLQCRIGLRKICARLGVRKSFFWGAILPENMKKRKTKIDYSWLRHKS